MRRARNVTLAPVARGFAAFIVLIGASLGCGGGGAASDGGPTGPEQQAPPQLPALETIPFQLLGAGKIAFERIHGATGAGSGTYVVDASAGTSTYALVNQLAFASALSPDGRRLAYITIKFGIATGYDVYVANADGTGEQQVTKFPENEGAPAWTPDGSRIVVPAGVNTGTFNVYSQSPVANPADQAQLTQFTVVPGTPFTCPILTGPAESRVAVSAQGRMTFACLYGEIDVSTSGTFSTAYKPARTDRRRWPNVFAPSWSPDGARIAFIETTSDSAANYAVFGFAVKVMDADGSNVATLANVAIPLASNVVAGGVWLGLNNLSLCWMPDGSRVVFNLPEGQLIGHLWVVRADGTGLAQLTSAPGVWDRSVSCSS
jgi:Tol biopolymer transport system component